MSETLFDPTLKKKKKSTKSKPAFVTEDEPSSGAKSTPASEMDDLSLGDGNEFEFKKKKKKSKSAAASAVDDFEAALEQAGVPNSTAPTNVADDVETVKGLEIEIGYQAPEGTEEVSYDKMLDRFFQILRENNPEMASDRQGVKYKIPPPIVGREGNKKTLFSNIKTISNKMHRPTEHVIHYLFAELGTSGSVDGSQRLVIKGKFQQKAIEGVLRRYIMEYVTCKTCKSVNTRLLKENRLYFLECNSCGSRRSVQSIKAGYQAVTRDARKKAHTTT